jgi:hypothetical protein
MTASHCSGTMGAGEQCLAASRAILLFLKRLECEKILLPLQEGPMFRIIPLKESG